MPARWWPHPDVMQDRCLHCRAVSVNCSDVELYYHAYILKEKAPHLNREQWDILVQSGPDIRGYAFRVEYKLNIDNLKQTQLYLKESRNLFVDISLDTPVEGGDAGLCIVFNRQTQHLLKIEQWQHEFTLKPDDEYDVILVSSKSGRHQFLDQLRIRSMWAFGIPGWVRIHNKSSIVRLSLHDCECPSLGEFTGLQCLILRRARNVIIERISALATLRCLYLQECQNVQRVFDYLGPQLNYICVVNSILPYELIITGPFHKLRVLRLQLVRSKKVIIKGYMQDVRILHIDPELELTYPYTFRNLQCLRLGNPCQRRLGTAKLGKLGQLIFIHVTRVHSAYLMCKRRCCLQIQDYKLDFDSYQLLNSLLPASQFTSSLNVLPRFDTVVQCHIHAVRSVYSELTCTLLGYNRALQRTLKHVTAGSITLKTPDTLLLR